MTHDAHAARLAELAAEDQRILADPTIPRADKAHHAQAVNKISLIEQKNRRLS